MNIGEKQRPIDPKVTYAIELPSKISLRAMNPALAFGRLYSLS
jgi:hypothetical protein